MKISGFTFVRNAVRLQYPIAECIQSVLPIVDEFVVVTGDSSDETVAAVQAIGSPKIRLVPSRRNPNARRYRRSRLSRLLGRRALIPGFDSAARIVMSHRTGYVGVE